MDFLTAPDSLHCLKRRVYQAGNSVLCHLRSIEEDASVVRSLTSALPASFPVYGNKRNGAWYGEFTNFCYFKSTDGHDRNLLFNTTTRLNFEVAITASRHGGALVVDSTRRGKLFPDALRSTIPLWCSVINACLGLVQPGDFSGFADFLMPPALVERIATETIPEILASMTEETKRMVVDRLGGNVNKPLRPVWIYPDSDDVLEWKGEYADEVFRTLYSCDRAPNLSELSFTPLLLLSASAAKKARHVSEQSWEYIQGAGDDEEHWACGLTPDLFWKNKDRILSSHDPHTVEETVRMVIAEQGMAAAFEFVVPGTGLTSIGADCTSNSPQSSAWDGVLALMGAGMESHSPPSDMGENVLVMTEKEVSFSSAVEWFGGLRRLKGIPDPRVLVRFYSTSPNVAMQIILVLVLAFASTTKGRGENAFAIIPLGHDPRAVVSKEELRTTVPIFQSLLPGGTLWHPSKRALKQVYFFFGGSELR